MGSSCRDGTLRGYGDYLSLFREHVESRSQSDQSGSLTFTSRSSDHGYRTTLFKAPGWISRPFLPPRNAHGKAKVMLSRWSDFNDSIRVGGQDYSAAAWNPATISGLGSGRESHSIQSQKYRPALASNQTARLKRPSNDRKHLHPAPAGRPSAPTISRLQTSSDVTSGKGQKRTSA